MTDQAALIIVDMQNVFLQQAQDLIVPVQEVARQWNESDIYWLKYRNHPKSLYEEHLSWSAAIVSPEIDLIEGKGQKQTYTHYGYSPPLEMIRDLQNKDYKTAYICGVDSDACVYAAMMSLWDHNIRPILLEDCCASSGGQTYHDAAIALMHRQFGMKSVIKGLPQ